MALQSDYGRAQTSRANYAALQLRRSTYLGFASTTATYPPPRTQTAPNTNLPSTYLNPIRFDETRRPLRNRIHQTRQIPPHLQRKHTRVHHAQIPRPVHHHPLTHDSALIPRSHSAGTDGMILAAEAVAHERVDVALVEFVEVRLLEGVAAVFEVGG